LSHGVQVTCETWQASMRIMTGVGDLVQRTENGEAHVGYSVAGRSSNTMCGMHYAQGDEERMFLDL
jgi:hypothetical protein